MGRKAEVEDLRLLGRKNAVNRVIAAFLDERMFPGLSVDAIIRVAEVGKYAAYQIAHELLFERIIRPGAGHDHYYLNESNPLVQFVRSQRKPPRGRRRR